MVVSVRGYGGTWAAGCASVRLALTEHVNAKMAMVRIIMFLHIMYNAAMRIVRLLLWGAVSLPLFAAANDCDRACLKTSLDQYLAAVIKHDPSAAPLFVGFRQTENSVVVRLGTGVWKSITGLGKMQRRYLDPVSEQAGYFGIVE